MNQVAKKIASFFVLMITVILVITLYMRYIDGQEPCPLCYLQQASMIGIALMELFNMRFRVSIVHYLGALLFAVLGAIISFYQLYLNEFSFHCLKGVNFLGFHLFVWSLFIFFCSTIGIISLLFLPNKKKESKGKISFFYWIVINSFLIVITGVAISSVFTTFCFS